MIRLSFRVQNNCKYSENCGKTTLSLCFDFSQAANKTNNPIPSTIYQCHFIFGFVWVLFVNYVEMKWKVALLRRVIWLGLWRLANYSFSFRLNCVFFLSISFECTRNDRCDCRIKNKEKNLILLHRIASHRSVSIVVANACAREFAFENWFGTYVCDDYYRLTLL